MHVGTLHTRGMLAGAAGLATLGATGLALPRRARAADVPADNSDITEDFLEKLFADNSEDIKPPGAAARLTQTQYRDTLADLERGVAIPKFAATEESPDLFHTANAISTTPFELKFVYLLALAGSLGFSLTEATSVPVAEVTPAPETVPEPLAEPVVAPSELAGVEPLVAPAPETSAAPPALVP